MGDKCRICKQDFDDCCHSIGDVDEWLKKKKLKNQLAGISSHRMKRIHLLLSPFKDDEPITKEVLLAVLKEL